MTTEILTDKDVSEIQRQIPYGHFTMANLVALEQAAQLNRIATVMTDYPRVPAAFINNIADEGTKEEAIEWLQKQWNETCFVKQQLASRDEQLKRNYVKAIDDGDKITQLEAQVRTLTIERDYLLSVNRMWHEIDQALTCAAQEFVAKVDEGEARSVRSYAAFKEALAIKERKT